jgi:MoxR-like ATPase
MQSHKAEPMEYQRTFNPRKVVRFGPRQRAGVGDRRDGFVYVYGDPKSSEIVLAVNVALATGRPLLVRGPSGSGKSSLALNVAHVMKLRYYEHVITSRTVALDLLWRFDVVRRLSDAQAGGTQPLSAYIEPGVLWWAFGPEGARAQRGEASSSARRARSRASRSGASTIDYGPAKDKTRAVVLLDEIDKADPDLPNSLLVPLGSFEFTVTDVEEGDVRAPEDQRPLVFITTNEERDLPPAFLRRCLSLTLRAPTVDQLVAIAKAHFGPDDVGLYKQVAGKLAELSGSDGSTDGVTGASAAEFIDAVVACLTLKIEPDRDPEVWDKVAQTALSKPRDWLTDRR